MIVEAENSTTPRRNDHVHEVIRRVAAADIHEFPFPHIIMDELFPPQIYDQVLRAMPPRSEFQRVEYPGTGFGRRNSSYRDFGYVLDRFHRNAGPLAALHDVFSSAHFAEVLLDKFSRPLPCGSSPIPAQKHKFFANGAQDHTTVFDLQLDLPGYAIAPHKDLPTKIVTFQFFLTADDSLADFGTFLCRPKDKRAERGRGWFAQFANRAIRGVPRENQTARKVQQSAIGKLFRRIERSRLGLAFGIGDTANWMPWEWFEIVKVAQALPNHFLAFAPNDKSFHAVNLEIPIECAVQERRVLRGFIMSGRNAKNWIKPLPAAM